MNMVAEPKLAYGETTEIVGTVVEENLPHRDLMGCRPAHLCKGGCEKQSNSDIVFFIKTGDNEQNRQSPVAVLGHLIPRGLMLSKEVARDE